MRSTEMESRRLTSASTSSSILHLMALIMELELLNRKITGNEYGLATSLKSQKRDTSKVREIS